MKKMSCLVNALLLAFVIGLGTGCDDKSGNVKNEKAATSAEAICPVLVGSGVPELVLRGVDGKVFNLNEAIKNKPTVLIFYRGGWCLYCNTQLGQLAQIESEIIKSGYQIIAVGPDRIEKLVESIGKHKMNYQLLSDSDMTGAKAFGIAFKVDDATIKKYEEYGIDLNAASGQAHNLLPVPAVFVIGTDGVIKFEYVNPDYTVRLDPKILLAIVKAEK